MVKRILMVIATLMCLAFLIAQAVSGIKPIAEICGIYVFLLAVENWRVICDTYYYFCQGYSLTKAIDLARTTLPQR